MALSKSVQVITLAEARAAGVRKDEIYGMVESGELERIGRGVYIRPDLIDPAVASLAAATAARPKSTLCLTSALVHHDLSDAIPQATDIALPRGTRQPAGFRRIMWHSFDRATFGLGRIIMTSTAQQESQTAADLSLAVYSPERTIVDCFRLAHLEGLDVAHEALRRWVRRRGSSPATLLQTATAFPKAAPRLRQALEVLL